MMRQHNYPEGYSAGLLSSGGIIAPIIPPSLPFIIYGVTTNTSISQLFISGVFPGLLMGGALLLAWRSIARKHQLPALAKTDWPERRKALVNGTWAIVMPILLLGGVRLGVFPPPEAAVVAAVFDFLVATFIYKPMKGD